MRTRDMERLLKRLTTKDVETNATRRAISRVQRELNKRRKAVKAMNWKPGDLVTYLYRASGSKRRGYAYPVDAEVLRVTAKRVTIQMTLAHGEVVTRVVRPESLQPRSAE